MGSPDFREHVDATTLSLSDWLELMEEADPEEIAFIHWQFPTDAHREEYLDTIGTRSEKEIRWLISRLLIPGGTLGSDEERLEALNRFRREQELDSAFVNEFHRRLTLHYVGMTSVHPWEGQTWILDLLPDHPRDALQGLAAYFLAHIQMWPDGRWAGMRDIESIIRARYVGAPQTTEAALEALVRGTSRDFECLVERVFSAMGYKTRLTPARKDGGRDIIAIDDRAGRSGRILIECKRYSGSVGVAHARQLHGVVTTEQATKGIIVSTGAFTRGAEDYCRQHDRLELIPGKSLVLLLNEFLGPRWGLRIDSLVRDSLAGSADA